MFTDRQSTELLDNLQIRTFDAFLLKGPGPPPSRVPSREGRCPGRHHGHCPFGFFSALPDSIVVEGWWDKYGWVKGFHIYNLSCPGSLVHLCPRMSLRLIQLPVKGKRRAEMPLPGGQAKLLAAKRASVSTKATR